MKYVVINVYDREIMRVGVADTPTEATEIMRADFMNEFSKNFGSDEEAENAFNDGYGKGDEWDCNATEAWLNGCYNYDWRIIEVEC